MKRGIRMLLLIALFIMSQTTLHTFAAEKIYATPLVIPHHNKILSYILQYITKKRTLAHIKSYECVCSHTIIQKSINSLEKHLRNLDSNTKKNRTNIPSSKQKKKKQKKHTNNRHGTFETLNKAIKDLENHEKILRHQVDEKLKRMIDRIAMIQAPKSPSEKSLMQKTNYIILSQQPYLDLCNAQTLLQGIISSARTGLPVHNPTTEYLYFRAMYVDLTTSFGSDITLSLFTHLLDNIRDATILILDGLRSAKTMPHSEVTACTGSNCTNTTPCWNPYKITTRPDTNR
jgi:hypothetical protein